MKSDVAGEDVNDLLVAVTVRTRLVVRHQPMQRQRSAFARKRLAFDARAHRRPGNGIPADPMDIHIRSSFVNWHRYLASPSMPPGRMNRKISSTESAATFLSPAP